MKLNKRIPGLPNWPVIKLNESKNEYVVAGRHVSYGRYILAQWLMRLVTVGYIYIAWRVAARAPEAGDVMLAFLTLGFLYLLVICFIPTPRLLCWLFFPRMGCVRFRKGEISFNFRKYEVLPTLGIQFRATPMPVSDEKRHRYEARRHKGLLKREAAHELNFFNVEMIYGSRVVPVTSIGNERKAEQYSVALQAGYELAKAHEQNPVQKPSSASVTVEDALPE